MSQNPQNAPPQGPAPGASPASPWGRLWQLPVLLGGLALFGYGLYVFQKSRHVTPLETHANDVQRLIDSHQYAKALQQIAVLQDYYTQPAQQAQLEVLAGDAFYAAQQEQPGLVEENYRKVIAHYRRAVTWGLSETPHVNERWATASLALGDFADAIHRLEPIVTPDPLQSIPRAKSLVNAYLALKYPAVDKALAILEKLAAAPDPGDRAWSLAKRLELTLGNPGMEQALTQAKTIVDGIKEHNPAGILRTWIGRAEFEAGRLDDAQSDLLKAHEEFQSVGRSLDDERAIVLLGKIAEAHAIHAPTDDAAAQPAAREAALADARARFQDIIVTHPGSPLVPAARLGRAEISAFEGKADETMTLDYKAAVAAVVASESPEAPSPHRPVELLTRDTIDSSLRVQHTAYEQAGRYQEALAFLELDQQLSNGLHESPRAEMAYREAVTQEHRADELSAELKSAQAEGATTARRTALYEEILHHTALAAESYLLHAKLSTLQDNVSGDSQWKAAQLFDKAGLTDRSIEIYRGFAAQRPHDPRVPEALHTIGQLYQSLGKFDEAIPYYQRNITENPKTPASYLSSVQLARCYMAQGEQQFGKAEQALLAVVQDNADLLPTANEFRVSLFALGELYYRTRRWADAILRLEEALDRYPEDLAAPRATFQLADSYRKSALQIGDALKNDSPKDPPLEHRDQLENARQDRLRRAAVLFARVIDRLDPGNEGGDKPGPVGLEEDYLRYSYLYRADCAYEQGDYPQAIRLYEQAATRFTASLTAVEAYVQIVNAYQAIKEPAQARAAAERAQWILQRVPAESFAGSTLALSRQYYENLFKLAQATPDAGAPGVAKQ